MSPCVAAPGYLSREGGGSCHGLEELRAEVSTLRETVRLMHDLVTQQHDLGQQTRLTIDQIAHKLQVPLTKSKVPEANSMEEEDEETVVTTLRP